jgi:tryptophan synthase alpha chain
MTRRSIREAFASAHAEGRAAFIPYIMLGYPDAETSVALAHAIVQAGADVLELGVPFSDPLADGATIQHASQRSLEQGITLEQCFGLAQAIAELVDVPLIFMGYYNPFLHMGLTNACERASASGIGGLIIPDVPVEEAGELIVAGRPYGIAPIFLVTPTSSDERIALVARTASEAESGFLYCVSLSGVTGARATLATDLPARLTRIRQDAGDMPLAVGFGVSTPTQAAGVAQLADGVIVASALINTFDAAPDGQGIEEVAMLARQLREAMKR